MKMVWGGGESVSCCSAYDLNRFGILVFGPQTRNLHPGGSAERGFGGWMMAAQGARWGREGCRMGCPSLLPLSLSLPPFACVQLLQLSVSPLTRSGSDRRGFKGPLLGANSAGTTAASWKDTPVGEEKIHPEKRFTREFSFMS